MLKRVPIAVSIVVVSSLPAAARQQAREKLDRVERELKSDVVNLVCVDDKFATAGQPKDVHFLIGISFQQAGC